DLTVSVQWLGQGNLKIDISIKNNEEFLNQPPGLPAITGPERGKFGENQSYQITAQDPDGNDLYYYIDWGDGTDIELIGPYGSGRTTTVKHNWAEKGSYTIKVMSRDVYDEKSDWASLEVSMPKQHLPSPYLQSLRERYQRVTTHLITFGNKR
ncbi:MAG: PKD domain-containing protein, partial [Thermoplasmatota archaeon]